MTLVFDASVVVAALTNIGPHGAWAERQLIEDRIVAPHYMLVEAANVIRRAVLRGELSAARGTRAHERLIELPIELHEYQPFASRVWELRDNVTAYDAWYVAIAEGFDAPLVTLDGNLARSPGPRCTFLIPPEAF